MAQLVNVPVTKGGQTVEIDIEKLPDEVFAEIVLQGCKVLMNRGMSNITKASEPDADKLKSLAMAAAEKNLQAMKDGKIKFSGKKVKKASGIEMTEARRIARALVKDALREAGEKISHYEAKDITAMANDLIEADPSILDLAKVNIKEREDKAKEAVSKIDLSKITASPKLVAKAEAEKAKKAEQLSAKQAGKPMVTKPKAKPEAQPAVQG